MEKLKKMIDLILLGNKHLHKAYIYCHMVKYGYVMIQLKKKFKNKRQVLATKKWVDKNREKYNLMKKGVSKRYYDSHKDYRENKSKDYYYKKECKRLQAISLEI